MAFFQQLLDLTIEEALVKYGFRYIEAKRWGRLRRLFEVAIGFKLLGGLLAAVLLAALAPFAKSVWGAGGVFVPMVIAATITIAQAPENVAASAIILRGRYDIRGAFLAVSMALRLTGIAIGSLFGLDGAVAGMAIAQVLATAAISAAGIAAFRRFPQAAAEPLGDDVAALRRFFFASSFASSLDSARGTLGTSLVPTVAPIHQAAYFDNALAPDTGLAAVSAPVRIVMLTEQTRDFEAGRFDLVARMLRRYIAVSSLLMVVAVPVFWVLMPFLLGVAYGPLPAPRHRRGAARADRRGAAADLGVDEVVSGLDRPAGVAGRRPVHRDRRLRAAAARPRLAPRRDRGRVGDASLDDRVLRGLDGRAAAPALRLARNRGGHELKVLVVSGIWPPDVGGPASHAPEVAAFLAARGHEVEVVITADAQPAREAYPVHWVRRSVPPGIRHLATVRLLRSRARRAEVVYTTGMLGRSSLAASLAGRPFVTKLTADPAYERARRWHLTSGSLQEFQHRPRG